MKTFLFVTIFGLPALFLLAWVLNWLAYLLFGIKLRHRKARCGNYNDGDKTLCRCTWSLRRSKKKYGIILLEDVCIACRSSQIRRKD